MSQAAWHPERARVCSRSEQLDLSHRLASAPLIEPRRRQDVARASLIDLVDANATVSAATAEIARPARSTSWALSVDLTIDYEVGRLKPDRTA